MRLPYRFRLSIIFVEFPVHFHENNVYSHNGNPDIGEFTCNIIAAADDVECVLADMAATNCTGRLLYCKIAILNYVFG